jgi:hypothetical protein
MLSLTLEVAVPCMFVDQQVGGWGEPPGIATASFPILVETVRTCTLGHIFGFRSMDID